MLCWHMVCCLTSMNICAWCYPGKRYLAQPTLRHAYSHGICPWHKRLMLAKLRISTDINKHKKDLH
jgi:hypothetical protein